MIFYKIADSSSCGCNEAVGQMIRVQSKVVSNPLLLLRPHCCSRVYHDSAEYLQLEKINDEKFMVTAILSERQILDSLDESTILNAIEIDARLISRISNATEEMKLLAVKSAYNALHFIKGQTEGLCIRAVECQEKALQFVENQTDEVCKIAIWHHGYSMFSQMRNPSDSVCLYAINMTTACISRIEKPSFAVSLAAVQQDGLCLDLLPKPVTLEICKAAMAQNPKAQQFITAEDIESHIRSLKFTQGKIKFADATIEIGFYPGPMIVWVWFTEEIGNLVVDEADEISQILAGFCQDWSTSRFSFHHKNDFKSSISPRTIESEIKTRDIAGKFKLKFWCMDYTAEESQFTLAVWVRPTQTKDEELNSKCHLLKTELTRLWPEWNFFVEAINRVE